MSKSNSKKKLCHNIRQGKLDPRINRNTWNIKPIMKVKENKKKDYGYDRVFNIA